MLRALIITVAVGLAGASAEAAASGPDRAYAPAASGSQVQDKNFYLLTLLQRDPVLRAAVARDPILAAEAGRRRAALRSAQANCHDDLPCELAPLRVSEAEAARLGEALIARLKVAGALGPLVRDHLRPSGRFERWAALDDAALVRRAWSDAADGMDRIVRVYGLGEAPLYPLIDSMSYPQPVPRLDARPAAVGARPVEAASDARSPETKAAARMWRDAVGDLVDVELDDPAAAPLFFDLPLSSALQLLAMNDRDEPARGEPLERGENAAALAYARTIRWADWPYPVMLIPGRSPVLKDDPLSPEARQKMRLAARRYAQRLAPIIVVSGGYVSPSQTRFNEALEMKRSLMRDYGVPERAILVDPHARHTTTNLRNTERLLFQAGAPLDRPILVTTTDYQSRYIEGQVFRDRCVRELGYACFIDLKRLSMFDTALRLPLTSLHRDARDPLDP